MNQGVYFHCGSGNVFRNNLVAFAGSAPGEWPFKENDISSALLPGMCNSGKYTSNPSVVCNFWACFGQRACNLGGNPTYPDMGTAVGFNFTTNIVLLSPEPAIVGTPKSSQKDVRNSMFARNTYFSENKTIVDLLRTAAVWPNGTTLAQFDAGEHTGRGADANIIADPMVVDAQARNFKLRSGSPALRLGFVELDDAASAGCSGNVFEPCKP